MVEPLLQTNRGAMTAAQIGDELTYRFYRYNRHDLGMTKERLARYFGPIPAGEYEARYRAEQRAA